MVSCSPSTRAGLTGAWERGVRRASDQSLRPAYADTSFVPTQACGSISTVKWVGTP